MFTYENLFIMADIEEKKILWQGEIIQFLHKPGKVSFINLALKYLKWKTET